MRVLFAAALCLTASTLDAQTAPTSPIAKGSRLVSGTASLTRIDVGGDGVTSINVNPMVLWFIRDRLAVGGELGVGYSTADDFSSTSWTIGPTARWFFAEANAKLLPFLGASVLFGKSSSEFGTFEFDGTTTGFDVAGGATRMLARNVGLTGELFVNRSTTEGSDGTSTSESTLTTFGVRFGFSAFLF